MTDYQSKSINLKLFLIKGKRTTYGFIIVMSNETV